MLSALPDRPLLIALFLAFCGRFVYQHLFQFPVLALFPLPLSPLSLSSSLLAPLISLLASLSHSPTFSVSPSPTTLLSVSSPLRIWGHPPGTSECHPLGIQRSLEMDRCPAVLHCSSALRLQQEGWAKGREWRPQWPNLKLGPRSGWERNEETRNLGREGVRVSERAKAAQEL